MTTPENITSLKDNQIFVFGSNLNGNHAGGAAKLAKDNFGAEEGVSEGLTGKTYAFPTLDKNMNKVSKEDLLKSKELLYSCALENKDKQFLLTKVGCGIAGFSEDEMKEIFKGEKPDNIIMPPFWNVVRGYKAFDEGLLCRGFQYEFGKDYVEKEAILCRRGFHFCKNLGDVYSYYEYGSLVCEIEAFGEVIDEEDGNKSVTTGIRLIRLLGAKEASNNNGSYNTGHSNTGHWNTGDRNTGHWNTGDRNTGNSNTGHWNTGDRNTGNRNTGHWNTGDRNTGGFNTKSPEEVLVFNKPCKYEDFDNADKPDCLYFNIKEWIDFSEMSEEEKKKYPSSKTCGGYLKTIDYKEAFTKSMQNASQEDIEKIKKLPNFDADIFEEISGFRIK